MNNLIEIIDIIGCQCMSIRENVENATLNNQMYELLGNRGLIYILRLSPTMQRKKKRGGWLISLELTNILTDNQVIQMSFFPETGKVECKMRTITLDQIRAEWRPSDRRSARVCPSVGPSDGPSDGPLLLLLPRSLEKGESQW